MLPSTVPLATPTAPLCLWKLKTAPLLAKLLLLKSLRVLLNVAGPRKLVLPYTAMLLLLLEPNVASPDALSKLPGEMLRGALTLIGDAKVALPCTEMVLLLLLPNCILLEALKGALAKIGAAKWVVAFTAKILAALVPSAASLEAVHMFPVVTVTGAFARSGAEAASVSGELNAVTARTVRFWLLSGPKIVLPATVSRPLTNTSVVAVTGALAVMGALATSSAVLAKVIGALNAAAALTVSVSVAVEPSTELPAALKRLPGATVTAELTVTGALKYAAALTVMV